MHLQYSHIHQGKTVTMSEPHSSTTSDTSQATSATKTDQSLELSLYTFSHDEPLLDNPKLTDGPVYVGRCWPGDDGGNPTSFHDPPCPELAWIPHLDEIKVSGKVHWTCDCRGEMASRPMGLVIRSDYIGARQKDSDWTIDVGPWIRAEFYVMGFILLLALWCFVHDNIIDLRGSWRRRQAERQENVQRLLIVGVGNAV